MPRQTLLKVIGAALVLSVLPALAAELPADLAVAVEEFDRAQFTNDVETLGRLFSDDYVLVNSDASVEDKKQALADFVAPGFKMEPYAMEEPVRQVSSDAAVLAGVVRLRWTQDGKQNTRTVRMVHVWMKRDGRWQATFTQVTRVTS